MMIFVSMPDSLLFDIYCVCGELSRAVSPPRRRALGRVLTVESSSVRPSETPLCLFCFPDATDKHKYYWLWAIEIKVIILIYN